MPIALNLFPYKIQYFTVVKHFRQLFSIYDVTCQHIMKYIEVAHLYILQWAQNVSIW